MRFKIGDRVEVVTNYLSVCGEVGTVSDFRNPSPGECGVIVMVALDSDPDDPWWLYEHQVEFVPSNGVQRMIECL